MKPSFRQNLSILLLLAASLHAKVVQPGLVRLQNSGNKPLAGVQVSFRGANITASDGKGRISLEFPSASEGERLRGGKASKPGFEWVNEPSVRDANASSKELLDLVFCPAGKLEANRQEYYGIIEAANTQDLERKLKAIESLRKRDLAAWQRQKDSLQKVYDEKLEQASSLAEKYARLNLDDVGEEYRKAFDLFKQGQLDESMRLFVQSDPVKRLGQRGAENATTARMHADAKALEEEAIRRERENRQGVEQDLTAALTLADQYVLKGDYAKAEQTYEAVLRYDSTRVENLSTVADFYAKTWKNYGKWESLNRQILSLATVPVWRRANASLSLGDMYSELGKLDSAGPWLREYHRLGDSLFRTDSTEEWNKQTLSISLERLGSWHQTQGDLEKALEYFLKEVKLFEELYHDNPKNESLKSGLAISYERLGSVQQASGDIPKALEAYRKAVTFSGELFQKNPGIPEYATNLAWYLKKTGPLACQLGQKGDGIAFLQRAANLYDSLYRSEGKDWQFNAAKKVRESLERCQDAIAPKPEMSGNPQKAGKP